MIATTFFAAIFSATTFSSDNGFVTDVFIGFGAGSFTTRSCSFKNASYPIDGSSGSALEGFSHDAVIGSFLFTFFCDFAFSSPARIGSALEAEASATLAAAAGGGAGAGSGGDAFCFLLSASPPSLSAGAGFGLSFFFFFPLPLPPAPASFPAMNATSSLDFLTSSARAANPASICSTSSASSGSVRRSAADAGRSSWGVTSPAAT